MSEQDGIHYSVPHESGDTNTTTDDGNLLDFEVDGSATFDEAGDTFDFANTNEEDATTSDVVSIDDYANLGVGGFTADDQSTFTQGLSSDGDITLTSDAQDVFKISTTDKDDIFHVK